MGFFYFEEIMNEFLRAWRTNRGMSQQQMAEEMKISASTLGRWERGQEPGRAYRAMLHLYMERKEKENGECDK